MSKPISALYQADFSDISNKLTHAIERGCQRAKTKPTVFFRADDIGFPSENFSEMMALFLTHKLPLCLATVPTWLTRERLISLNDLIDVGSNQWCFHQHGYVHKNFEPEGKKMEFGPSRSAESIMLALTQGRERLYNLLGGNLLEIFTPPWNRCSQVTIDSLVELGFSGLSRSLDAQPESSERLPDFQVNCDLHTRKETSPEISLTNLLGELEQGLASGCCGIMLHHQKMNKKAFHFLDAFLQEISRCSLLSSIHFGDLLQ